METFPESSRVSTETFLRSCSRSQITPEANAADHFLETRGKVERFAHVVLDVAIRRELAQSRGTSPGLRLPDEIPSETTAAGVRVDPDAFEVGDRRGGAPLGVRAESDFGEAAEPTV